MKRRGVTLIELLVAAACAAVLLVVVYGALAWGARGLRRGEAGLEANLKVQRVLEILRQDLRGPYPWNECNFPDEVLEKLGYRGKRLDFALEGRQVGRWFDFYREHRGPVAGADRYLAAPKRKTDRQAPCEVNWALCTDGLARWIGAGPADPDLDCSKAPAPWLEWVPSDQPSEPDIAVVGPAFWAWIPAQKKLLRWGEEDGLHELGEGLVSRLELLPVEEISVDEFTYEGRLVKAVSRSKSMLQVKLAVERDGGRPPIEIETLLAPDVGYGPAPIGPPPMP